MLGLSAVKLSLMKTLGFSMGQIGSSPPRTTGRAEHRSFLQPPLQLGWGALWTLHLMIRVRSDTLAKRKGRTLKIRVVNSYLLAGNLLVPSPPVSSARSRWSYKDVTDHALHFLTTDPAASQRREGNGKSLPPHCAEDTAVVVH